MTTNFKIVGKIMKPKEDSNWYEVKKNDKGETSLLNFNVKSNSNVFRMNLMGYLANDESARIVYAFKKENGKNVKCNFLYSEKDKYISELAEFSKMVLVEGNDRLEFCHNVDFIKCLFEQIATEKIIDIPIRIDGEIEYSTYTNKEGKEVQGKKYIPKRMYMLNEETDEVSEANIELLFDENSILNGETDEIMVVNGKVARYNSKVKKETLFEETVEFDFTGKGNKAINVMKNKLKLEEKEIGKLNKLGVKVDLIRGSEDIELTRDMLSDEENDLIDLGLMTIEELKREKGMGKGAFREKNIFKGLARGYSSGATLTDKTEKDYEIKIDMDVNDVFGNTEVINEDDIPF